MKFNNEMKIGVMVLGVVIGLLWLTFQIGNFNFFSPGYEIKVQFKDIDGVEKSAPVRLNGFEVGMVKDIQIIYEPVSKMELTVWIKDFAKLREGVKASVKNMGLMGEKYVELSLGDEGRPFIQPGAVIVGDEPVDFESLMAKGDAIATNLKEISANINERLKVNSQAIDKTIGNIASITDNVNERLIVNKNSIDELILHLNGAGRNLEELSADTKLNPWKLLYQPKQKKKVE